MKKNKRFLLVVSSRIMHSFFINHISALIERLVGYNVEVVFGIESLCGVDRDDTVCFVVGDELRDLAGSIMRCVAATKIVVPITRTLYWRQKTTKDIVTRLSQDNIAVVDYACSDLTHTASRLLFEVVASLDIDKFQFGYIPIGTHPGSFGVKRRHHYHTGVDLYVHRNNAYVYPFEDGEIVSYGHFTGTFCNSPWWNNTHYLAIKHGKYVVVYGEILLPESFISKDGAVSKAHIGDSVSIKSRLGLIVPVTKNRHPEYEYHNNKMLHVELYDAQKFRDAAVDEWELGAKQPGALLDATAYVSQFLL